MAFAELSDSGRIAVDITWSENNLIKMVPGHRWDPNTKRWHVPLSWGSCKVLRGVFGPRLTLGENLNAWAWNERSTRVEPSLGIRQVVDYPHGDQRLMPHQRADVCWWYYARQGLLANEPGCGKTASAVIGTRTLDHAGLDAFPALVVCPNGMKLTWAAEWAMWDPLYDPLTQSVHFLVVDGTPTQKRKLFKQAHDLIAAGEKVVMIVNWESTWRHSRVAPYGSIRLTAKDKEPKELNEYAWRTVIVDEAHRMKDAHSKQTRATWALQHAPTVDFRLAMTGTPVANHTGDLWALMHGVAPHEYPTKTAYIDRYCTPPDSMVWMADGTFKQIGDVEIGDLVMGFSKVLPTGKGTHPRYSPARVTHVNRRRADLVRLKMKSGREIVCTPDHRWLAGIRSQRNAGVREMQFYPPRVGGRMCHVIDVPEPLDPSLRDDAMWLGGVYDGEGSAGVIAQSVAHNPAIHARIGEVLKSLGIDFRVGHMGYVMRGGRNAYARFLHYCRPTKRYMISAGQRYHDAYTHLFTGALGGTGRSGSGWDEIVSIESLPRGPVVSLTTDLETYIVQGYASHNCLQSYSAFGALEILGVRPDTAEEFYSIFDPRFRRMTKDVVLAHLPKKVRPLYHCRMNPKQRKAYIDIDEQMITRLDDGSVIMTTNNLARNTRLLQFASAYAVVDDTGNVRLSEPSPKLDTMEEILEDREGQQIVIAAESRQLIELAALRLQKKGISFAKIVGGMSQLERDQQKAGFQAGQYRCMLMTLKAGGVGITLTAAGTIVFLQRSWSLVDNLQGEDRVHRIGSEIHDKVEVIDMVTEGTIEELLIPRMKQKLERLQEITRDKELLLSLGRVDEAKRLEAEAQVILATPLWARDGDLTALIDTTNEEEVA